MKSSQYIKDLAKGCTAGTLGLSLIASLIVPAYATDSNGLTSSNTDQSVQKSVLSESMQNAQGTISVYVQFKGKGAYEATQPQAVLAGVQSPVNAKSDVQAISQAVEAQAQQVAAKTNSEILYTTHNATRGVALVGDAAAIRDLASRSDVKYISPIVSKYPENALTDVDTAVTAAWIQTGKTGKNVRVAVVDSGIDYTHADFGGPGTTAAYEQAAASTDMPTASSGLYDPQKYVGGYDLVGDDYNAKVASTSTPKPDSNPLDCKAGTGHGTHVAGTALGYGVTKDGKTYRGSYSHLTDEQVQGMSIGPGSAPEAQLIGLRVFGCKGASDMTGAALDRALDPNGDGDFSDKADIINLSLGSDYGATDDPENAIIEALTRQGILSVIAAGNSGANQATGDTYSIAGSPGNSISSLTVANSVGSSVYRDRAVFTDSQGKTWNGGGDYTTGFDYANASANQMTGQLVLPPADNRFACAAYPADSSIKGKWVFIDWANDSGNIACSTTDRFKNLAAAGAKGVVIRSNTQTTTLPTTGSSALPGIRLAKSDGDTVYQALQAGEITVTFNAAWKGIQPVTTGNLDTIFASSARGQHGSAGFTKPDVAAPGTNIASAGAGSGTGSKTYSGTSMAAPRVAGIAALIKEAHPAYSPQQIKAAIMNTAVHDVKTSDGKVFAVDRVGSGRVDALRAVNQGVFVYNSDNPNLVSLSYGVTEFQAGSQTQTLTRNFTVENNEDIAHTYAIGLEQSTTMPGVTFSMPQTITVAPHSTAKFTATVTVDPSQLDKTADPATALQQVGKARQFIASASGRVTLTENNQQIRVPIHIAPKPTSAMKAEADFASLATAGSQATIKLTGTELNQGSYTSLMGAFELGVISKRISTANLAVTSAQQVDLQYVGAYSDAQELADAGKEANTGILAFGVSTWANWDTFTPNSTIEVSLDTNKDGVTDYILRTVRTAGLDYPTAKLYKVANGQETLLKTTPINGSYGNQDTNIMDTNVMVLTTTLADLGLTKASDINYKVNAYSTYVQGEHLDGTDWITYNPFAPNVSFSGGTKANSVLYQDLTSNSLTIKSTGKGSGVLFLHLHNATGDLTGQVAGEDGGKAQVALFTATSANPNHQPVYNPLFTDVNQSTPFYQEITWLASRGITRGWDDGTFRPNSNVSRAVMAAFFYRLAGSPQFTAPTTSPFTDVSTTDTFYKEISWMASQGITKGWPDGTFRPNEPVQRDAMAAFFYRMAGSPAYSAPEVSPFTDISSSTVFYKEISWMRSTGISYGWDDGTYRPLTAIHRDAMAAFIYRFSVNVLKQQ